LESSRSRVAELYGRYGPVVYRRCLRLLHDREAARDATQEVFMRLVKDMARLEDRENVLPWIYRVATNHCLNLLRSHRRHGDEIASDDLPLAAAEGTDYPTRSLARHVLSQFDEGTQAVAIGVLVDGMEHEELAQSLGISRKTVERRLARFITAAKALLTGGGT
jgi:RNA polymerase sigma-70 factor (ECF subfamily)